MFRTKNPLRNHHFSYLDVGEFTNSPLDLTMTCIGDSLTDGWPPSEHPLTNGLLCWSMVWERGCSLACLYTTPKTDPIHPSMGRRLAHELSTASVIWGYLWLTQGKGPLSRTLGRSLGTFTWTFPTRIFLYTILSPFTWISFKTNT